MATRGTSNGNAAGSSYDRRRRKMWLVETYRADVDIATGPHPLTAGVWTVRLGTGTPVCRCYRCGELLTIETVTVDRIVPGCQGGTYRRNNIRPACSGCNSKIGGALRRKAA